MKPHAFTPKSVASLPDAELSEAVARVVFGATRYDFFALPHAPEDAWAYARVTGKANDAVVLRVPTHDAGAFATSVRLMPDSPVGYSLVLEHMRLTMRSARTRSRGRMSFVRTTTHSRSSLRACLSAGSRKDGRWV